MIFSSFEFFVFFAGLLLTLAVCPLRFRSHLLLVASWWFYAAWDVRFLLLIWFVSGVGYVCGLRVWEYRHNKTKSLRVMWLGVASMLLVLAYFKYTNFLIDSFAPLLHANTADWHQNILLPIGLSFFTFQVISYLVDVYREDIEPSRSAREFFLYVAFFPQLVAGPIVRARDFLPQLQRHIGLNYEYVYLGAQIFALGFVQKIFIADRLSSFVDPVFSAPAMYDAATLWLGLLAYSVQIFCDFSGYSHMAIGIALILGFRLPENFRMPYLATSIANFWQRWHISLSSWLRDYLYIPLGGSRCSPPQVYMNLMITMLLGGLWHGASWNFVLWGGLHGVALVVHRAWRSAGFSMPWWMAWPCCFLFVLLTWVPFRSGDFALTMQFYAGLLATGGLQWIAPQVVILLALVAVVHMLMACRQQWISDWHPDWPESQSAQLWHVVAWFWVMMILLVWAPMNSSPFIYFQF